MESKKDGLNLLTSIVSDNISPIILQRIHYCLIPLVLFFAFAKLGDQPVHQWDEARTAINAIDMLNNGDWINLHFGGKPDKIRAKPPFVVWMVATNFLVFGYNTFALRLHSAIAVLVIFFFVFKIVRLYKSTLFASAVVLVLLSVRGILGFHVGRTGDFDAVLMAFLLAGLYYFLLFLDFAKARCIYWAALLWGLAFFTKGPAMGVLFPGILLYVVFTQRLGKLLKDRKVYLAGALCLCFPLIWYLTLYFFGVQLSNPEVSGNNAFERMFLYDLKDRFTQTQFEGKTELPDPLFLWHYLQEHFTYWHLAFLVLGLFTLIQLFVGKTKLPPLSNKPSLLVLSLGIWISLGGFLSIVTAAKPWYFAPAIPFLTISFIFMLEGFFIRQRLYTVLIFLVFWHFAMFMRYFGPKPIATAGSKQEDFFSDIINTNKQRIESSDVVIQYGSLPAQRILCELFFANPNVKYHHQVDNLSTKTKEGLIFVRKGQELELPIKEILDEDENYMLISIFEEDE